MDIEPKYDYRATHLEHMKKGLQAITFLENDRRLDKETIKNLLAELKLKKKKFNRIREKKLLWRTKCGDLKEQAANHGEEHRALVTAYDQLMSHYQAL